MALSAATHVPAQVAFAVVFAGVLIRRGLVPGAAAGALAYVACSLALAECPDALDADRGRPRAGARAAR